MLVLVGHSSRKSSPFHPGCCDQGNGIEAHRRSRAVSFSTRRSAGCPVSRFSNRVGTAALGCPSSEDQPGARFLVSQTVWGQPPSAVRRAQIRHVPGFSFLKPCGDSRPRLSIERSSTRCPVSRFSNRVGTAALGCPSSAARPFVITRSAAPYGPGRPSSVCKVSGARPPRYEFAVVGYVVMPEHFPLLISEPENGTPSVVIQALKLGVVRRPFPTSRKSARKSGVLGKL